MSVSRLHKVSSCLLGVSLLLGSCGSGDDSGSATDSDSYSDGVAESVSEAESEFADDVGVDGQDAEEAAGQVDESLDRADVDCSAEGIGSSAESEFSVAHVVVGGSLGKACYGDYSDTLVKAWESLAVITPPLQLADLALFGGFSTEETDEVTLAFVNVLDDDGTAFQMSVNLAEFEADGDEALLTMAHEFSHVFTGLDTQLDRSDEAFESCDTYFNGEGCYRTDSLMFQWIQEFWDEDLISQIDPYGDASGAGGQDRCDLNAGFFGAYGASTPEEDFAESFSAMVFRLAADSDAQQLKLDWLANQAGLAEFRDRAVAAGIGPLANNFDLCGSDA